MAITTAMPKAMHYHLNMRSRGFPNQSDLNIRIANHNNGFAREFHMWVYCFAISVKQLGEMTKV